MGVRLVKFKITPKKDEQIEAEIIIPEETRAVIHGIVKDQKGKTIKDAVVKLFEVVNPCDPKSVKPITHTFTDDCGEFLFGPLCADKQYTIKVWYNAITIHHIVIEPDDDDYSSCLHYHHKTECDDKHYDKDVDVDDIDEDEDEE